MARMTPETRTRLEGFKAVNVKHPRLDEVDQQVTQAIDEHAGYTLLLLYGPSGVGKSTVIRRIAERFCTDAPHPARVPVVLIEARPSDTGTYVRLDYYRQVLLALKAHVVVKELLVNITTAPTPTRGSRHATEWLDLREAVEQALARLHVQAVIIDESQHLMQVAAPLKPADQLDWLIQTVAATLGEADATLTLAALTRHALQPAQRVRLEVEARAGEHKVEVGNATGYEQLQALLGPPARPRSVPLLPLTSPTLPGPGAPSMPSPDERSPDSTKRRRRVGQRAPARDPGGG